MSRSSAAGSRTIYVGNLPGDTREREVEDLFHKFGRIVDIDLKIPPRPPGYAFVEFDDERDAEDAIKHRDGYDFDGNKIRVELAHGGSRGGFERGGFGGFGGRVGGRPPGAVSKRSEYRVTVTGLPASASWQDLKDHMRKAGDVCFAQVFRDGKGTMGIVDYTSQDDMKYAIKKLDDSEFKNPFSRGYIRVREDRSGGGRARTASRSPSRSYSRSSRSRSRSASRSKSPASRSRSNTPADRDRSPDRKRSPPSRGRSKSPAARPRSRSPPASESPRPAPSRSRSRSAAAASP